VSRALKSGDTRKQSAAWPEHGPDAPLFAVVRQPAGVLRLATSAGVLPAQRPSVDVALLGELFAAINSVPRDVGATLEWLRGKPRDEALDLIEP